MNQPYSKQTILNELVAHRGASEHAPENTMAAFRLAEQQGAKWLEFDVSTAGDGTPIIMHDATTDRCSDQKYTIGELHKNTIKTIDAGAWFAPEFAGERIPLFTEVLQWLRSNELHANVEIKRHPEQQNTKAFVQPILECLLDHQDLWPRLLVTSFDASSLEYCLEHAPGLNYGALFDTLPPDWLDVIERWGVDTIHIHYKRLSKSMLLKAQQRKLTVRCYTPSTYEDIAPYLYMGLTSVIVNSPLRFSSAIIEQFE